MDFNRLLLIGALMFVSLLLWEAWQRDYGPQPPTATATAPAARSTLPEATPGAAADGAPADAPAQVQAATQSAERVSVLTDIFRAELDTAGGDLRRLELLEYPVSIEQRDAFVTLLNDQTGGDLFIAQSGLLAAGGSNLPAPNHYAAFTAEQTRYVLEPGSDSVTARLTWRDASGVEVEKSYTFHRGSYLIDVGFTVKNAGGETWTGQMYRQLQRARPTDESRLMYTYTGGVISTPEERYLKVDFDDMAEADLETTATGGWLAMIQHYFLSAWVPPSDQSNRYYSRSPGQDRFVLGMVGPSQSVAPGESVTFGAQLYAGPKIQERLEAIAPGLELTVDYGVLTLIAKPIWWLLDVIHGIVNNWGWSIVLLTVLIKGLFYKLSETSYRSMAHMRKVQPKLAALKEKYGDNREKMNEGMMRLYKEEKINPLGGCLPILVQIPVFISLYWVLLEAVELRQADWILWINDLSIADPYFVLPLLMGATMLIQHKLNPTPLDPVQAKVMMALPIIFTVFFAFFPAGLVLYWVVNNTLSIAQQWYITRFVVKA